MVDYEKMGAEPAKLLSLTTHLRPQRLFRFIHELMVRPNQPPVNVSEEVDLRAIRTQSNLTSSLALGSGSGNPESDSFGYIETVLESLAVLGELGNGLDLVAQRLPLEIYSLVENTIEEVNERAEFNKRMAVLAPGIGTGSVINSGAPDQPASTLGDPQTLTPSNLRLPSLESSLKPGDQETLKDMFWTLYSKLDAVLQGLRIVFEVANRIGSVRVTIDSNKYQLNS